MVVVTTVAGPAAAAPAAHPIASLSARSAIPLHVGQARRLDVAEAPGGAVFYAPYPDFSAKGKIKHGAAAKVVRVVDGTHAPAVAEHLVRPALAIAASKTTLYIATTKQVLSFSRKSGKPLRHWPLPHRSTYASLALASKWLYVDSAFECDFCGYEPTMLVAINLHSTRSSEHTVATKVAPGTLVARGPDVYFGVIRGHLVRTTAEAPTNHAAARSPHVGLSVLGFFGDRLLTWGPTKSGKHAALWVLNPATLAVKSTRTLTSESAFDLIPTPDGPVYSDSTCPRQLAAGDCTKPSVGELGTEVSQYDLASGELSNSVPVQGVDFLLGPKAAAITVVGGTYHLVRIAPTTVG